MPNINELFDASDDQKIITQEESDSRLDALFAGEFSSDHNPAPQINYDNAKQNDQGYMRAVRATTGTLIQAPGGKPVIVVDPLEDELAYSSPSMFEALKTRANEVGEKVISNPIKSLFRDTPTTLAVDAPGGVEFLASGATMLAGALTGVGVTGLEAFTDMFGYRPMLSSPDEKHRSEAVQEARRRLTNPDEPPEVQAETYLGTLGNKLVHNVHGAMDALTYQPRTDAGQALVGLFGMTFDQIAADSQRAADYVFEKTGSPAAATAVRIIPDAVMMLGPLGMRGKSGVMEQVERIAKQKADGEAISVFDLQTKKEFDPLTPDDVKARADAKLTVAALKQKGDAITEAEQAQLKTAEEAVSAIDKKEMIIEQNSIKTAMSPHEVLSYISDEELATLNRNEVTTYLMGGNEGFLGKVTEPVELKMTPEGLTVVRGKEASAAAALIGEDKVPVRIIVEKANQEMVDKLSTTRAKIVEATRERKEAIAAANKKSFKENVATWVYDRTFVAKNRLIKNFGKDAIPAIQLFEGLKHSSTSGGLFAKVADNRIFSGLTDDVLVTRELGEGKTQTLTERDVFNQIANNRMALAIASRRPDYKFPGNLRKVHYEADMTKLQQELGPKKFIELNKKVDELIGPRGFYNELLQRRLHAGLIDQKMYNKLKNFDYDPIKYLDEIDPILQYDTMDGKTITQRSSGVEKLTGGKTSLVELDARTLFVDMALRVHKQIATNNAVRALAQLHDKYPKNKLIRRIKDKDRLPTGAMKIEFFENGQKRFLAVDPAFGEMWKYSTPDMLRQTANVFKWASGSAVVKASAVGLNPLFFLRDIPRNISMMTLGGARTLSGRALYASNWDYVPIAGALTRPVAATSDMFAVLPDAIRRRGLFNDLAEHNAFPVFLADVAMEEMHPFFKKHPKIHKLSSALAWTNQTAEIMMRMAVARRVLTNQKALGQPINMQEAAYEAARIIDYGQSGYISGALDHIIPFFNPAVQGARAVARGFKEDPMHNTAYALNIMGMAGTAYLWNYFRAPETMSQIPEEHLVTGLVFPLADWMRTEDPSGNIIYPYIHIPIDNMAMPFIGGANWLMRYNITGEIPSQPIRDMFTNIMPGGGVPNIPMMDALTKVFANYDVWKGAQVYPSQEAISQFMEYYPIGHRKETPRFYVWAGETMNSLGLGQVDMASPERLRAAVDAFVGSSPFSHLWSSAMDPLLDDPRSYKSQYPFEMMLAQQPGIRSVFKMTSPTTNAYRSLENMPKDYADLQQALNGRVTTLLQQTRTGGIKREDAIKQIVKAEGVPPDMREKAIARYVSGVVYDKIVSSIPADFRIGLPGLNFWQSSAENVNARDRATMFFNEWKRKGGTQRDAMWNLARRMSTPGLGFSYIDRDGKFLQRFNQLKSIYGTEVESSFIDLNVDVATPSLDRLNSKP